MSVVLLAAAARAVGWRRVREKILLFRLAETTREIPSAEDEEAGFAALFFARAEGANEELAVEVGLLRRHYLQLQSAARAELVVGVELVWLRVLLAAGWDVGLGFDLVVVFFELLLFELEGEDALLEGVGEGLGLIFGTALGDHHLPVVEVGVVALLFGEELDPSIQQLGIETSGVGSVFQFLLGLAGDLPGRDHVCGGLRGIGFGELIGRRLVVGLHGLFGLFGLRKLLAPEIDFGIGNEGVLLIGGGGEDSA